jgi:hypothetical protein
VYPYRIIGLVMETKPFFNSAIGIDLLFVYDVATQYLELDLFYLLVTNRISYLFWLQLQEQQVEYPRK